MTPNIPISALPILGAAPTPDGWGGVPWMHGVVHLEPLQGLRDRSVTSFGYAPGGPVMTVTDGENDLDGPGGWRVDPCGQPQTSLRNIHGVSCDSRAFRGVVISPILKEQFGIKLGDFVLVTWKNAGHWAQVYDFGPTHKQGEFSIYLARLLGLVPADWTDRRAAIEGHDAEDICTLFFPGSGPGHALPEAAIIAGARACWEKFTSRQADTEVVSGGKPAAVLASAKGSRAASGSVGSAALLCLVAAFLSLPASGCAAVRQSAYFPESVTLGSTFGREDASGWDRQTVGVSFTWRLKLRTVLAVTPAQAAPDASRPAGAPPVAVPIVDP